MSGLLKRPHLKLYGRNRASSIKRPTLDCDLIKVDFPPQDHRSPSPHFSTPKASHSPYALHKKEGKSKVKPKLQSGVDGVGVNERLDHSFSCAQMASKLSKSGSRLGDVSSIGARVSMTPKDGARSNSSTRFQPVSRLEPLNLEHSLKLIEDQDDPEHLNALSLYEGMIENMIKTHPRLADALDVIRKGYQRHIHLLNVQIVNSNNSELTLKSELESSQKEVSQLKCLLVTLQEKVKSLTSALENVDRVVSLGRDSSVHELTFCKKQNEFLMQVLKHIRSQGYPLTEAYLEVQKQTVSTAGSGDPQDTGDRKPLRTSPSPDKEGKGEFKVKVFVPRLQLPKEPPQDFQQEFLSKFEEFSESWRLQASKNHADGSKKQIFGV